MDLAEVENSSDIQSRPSGEISVLDGRLYFPSKESLGEVFSKYADAGEESLFDFIRGFYNDGFFSLRAPIYQANEDVIGEQYEKRVAVFFEKYGSIMDLEDVYQQIDDTQFVIGSDTFAALLNENGEIHVGDEIFKYTDVGLFFIDADKYSKLTDFLLDRKISDNLIIRTTESAATLFSNSIIGRGYSELDGGNIHFFVARCGPLDPSTTDPWTPADPDSPMSEPCDIYIGGGGGSPNPAEPLDGLQDFVDNLPVCKPSYGLFGNLFGINRICIDKYESRMRVRTKAFNYNYWLVFHTGVKVKHQSRNLGLWSTKKTSVVAVGIEMMQFEYDYSSIITSGFPNLNPGSVKYSVKPKNFTYNVQTNIWDYPNGNQNYTLLNTSSWTPNLPTVFHDDLIIEAFNMGYTFSSDDLNNHFWKSIWNSAKGQIRSLANDPNWENPLNMTLLSNYPNMKKLIVQRSYFSHCIDCSKRNKTLAFDGAFTLGIGYNTSSGNFTYTPGLGHLIPPKNFNVKMYGAAKRNGAWHGSKLQVGID